MKLLGKLLWSRRSSRNPIVQRARQMRGMRYCWPPHPWKDCMDCGGYLPPTEERMNVRPPA
jgi:hypothetical protein